MPWDCTQWQAQRSIGHDKPWEVQTNAFQSLASVKIVRCAINPQTHCKSFRSLQDPLHVQQMFFATLAKSWSLKEKVCCCRKSIHELYEWRNGMSLTSSSCFLGFQSGIFARKSGNNGLNSSTVWDQSFGPKCGPDTQCMVYIYLDLAGFYGKCR